MDITALGSLISSRRIQTVCLKCMRRAIQTTATL